jgi:hypothetical protein
MRKKPRERGSENKRYLKKIFGFFPPVNRWARQSKSPKGDWWK